MTAEQIITGAMLLVMVVAAVALAVLGRRQRQPPTLEHQIGAVIATGMDRVDQLRWTGADAFQTLMPMPNGECWSVMVRRFPDEPSARATIGFGGTSSSNWSAG